MRTPVRMGAAGRLDPEIARRRVTLKVRQALFSNCLDTIARSTGLQLIIDESVDADARLTLSVEDLPLSQLIDELEALFPMRFEPEGTLLRVRAAGETQLPLLVYPLDAGLVFEAAPLDFRGLNQLSFISRNQQTGEERDQGALAANPEIVPTHVERFLGRLPDLYPWPEGSSWYLDKQRNLVFVRSADETLDRVQESLDLMSQLPLSVVIEAYFVEVGSGFGRELGVEFSLLEDYAVRKKQGESQVVLGEGSGTQFGIPEPTAGVADGLRLSVLGLLTEPSFRALLRAIQTDERAEVLSAPSVAAVNNSRATLALTTNLPYVEGYEPVFDRQLVAADGLSSTDSDVALVAQINDENFVGIVLNVTPSIGADHNSVLLRLQPVVRDQVDEVTIQEGAVVSGVMTPRITRPVIETRFLDTQLTVPDGGTVILGGLRTQRVARLTQGIPGLMHIPIIGRLFRRETESRESRELLIFVSARLGHFEGGS